MVGSKETLASMAATLILGCLIATPAQSAPHAVEYFGRVTPSQSAQETKPTSDTMKTSKDGKSIQVKWFEAIDDVVGTHKPSDADRVILARPFNQEAERVQQWIEIASKVAKNYRAVAKALRSMPVPEKFEGFKEYRDLRADWFSDAAAVYEDLVRPRRASRTMEELDESINQIKERAQSVQKTNLQLAMMDRNLRSTHHVHPSKYDDPLQRYVRNR
jgi:hypothetical protein